jgi:hypothetical protein
MNDDLEFEKWKFLWQAEVTLPSGMREIAKKQMRRLRMMLWADIGVTVGVGGAAAIWGIHSAEPAVRVLAIWVWLTVVTAWIFRWFNSGGNWTGAAPNTHVFLERLRKSYRSTLRNIVFGWVLGAAQIMFCSGWVYRELNRHGNISISQFMILPANLLLFACATSVLAWSVWLFRKLTRELKCVQQLQSECDEAEGRSDEGVRSRAARLIKNIRACVGTLPNIEIRGIQNLELRRKRKSRA